MPTPLKGRRQEKAYFSWPQHFVPVWEVGREGDMPGMFKERKGIVGDDRAAGRQPAWG